MMRIKIIIENKIEKCNNDKEGREREIGIEREERRERGGERERERGSAIERNKER